MKATYGQVAFGELPWGSYAEEFPEEERLGGAFGQPAWGEIEWAGALKEIIPPFPGGFGGTWGEVAWGEIPWAGGVDYPCKPEAYQDFLSLADALSIAAIIAPFEDSITFLDDVISIFCGEGGWFFDSFALGESLRKTLKREVPDSFLLSDYIIWRGDLIWLKYPYS